MKLGAGAAAREVVSLTAQAGGGGIGKNTGAARRSRCAVPRTLDGWGVLAYLVRMSLPSLVACRR